MNLEAELKNLGLSDKEAKVYKALLELSSDTVQNIAKKADVNRATTYVVLKSLIDKGLCSTVESGKKVLFTASEPAALEGIFELQKKEIEERQKYFQRILPNIEAINNKSDKGPNVKFYEGLQGLINCANEFIQDQDPANTDNILYAFFSRDKLEQQFTEQELAKHRQLRINRKAATKVLYNSSKTILEDNQLRTARRIDAKDFPFDSDIAVFGDSIRILNFGKQPTGILIKDKAVAKTLKSLFELAWEAAKTKQKSK